MGNFLPKSPHRDKITVIGGDSQIPKADNFPWIIPRWDKRPWLPSLQLMGMEKHSEGLSSNHDTNFLSWLGKGCGQSFFLGVLSRRQESLTLGRTLTFQEV